MPYRFHFAAVLRWFALAAPMFLQAQLPEAAELQLALANASATFARTVPSLTATERLNQHGRRGEMQFGKKTRKNELRDVSFTLPEEFQTHEVVSAYRFGTKPGSTGFHEIRAITMIDGKPPVDANPRHAMTLGLQRPDDGAKKELLENLEQDRLVGAAADFGPMLLLFTESGQRGYRFKVLGAERLGRDPAYVLGYRQVSGPGAVAEFREREEVLHAAQGKIWFRQSDLLPLRITFEADEVVAPKFILRNEADITYRPTPYGLAPELVLHRQYLNQDLLVENRFTYSAYNGMSIIP